MIRVKISVGSALEAKYPKNRQLQQENEAGQGQEFDRIFRSVSKHLCSEEVDPEHQPKRSDSQEKGGFKSET